MIKVYGQLTDVFFKRVYHEGHLESRMQPKALHRTGSGFFRQGHPNLEQIGGQA